MRGEHTWDHTVWVLYLRLAYLLLGKNDLVGTYNIPRINYFDIL